MIVNDIAKWMFFVSLVFMSIATGDMHVTAITLAAMYLECAVVGSDYRMRMAAREIVVAACSQKREAHETTGD